MKNKNKNCNKVIRLSLKYSPSSEGNTYIAGPNLGILPLT